MGNVNNVTTGKPKAAGWCYCGSGTAPTSASATIPTTMKDMGYLGDAGVTNSNSPTVENIKAWGGAIVMVSSTERGDTFKFVLLETTNVDVQKVVYGANNVTTASNTTTIKVNNNPSDKNVWVFDMITSNNKAHRIVIPIGILSGLEDIEYKDNGAVGYGVTISALPDSTGNTHYEYFET